MSFFPSFEFKLITSPQDPTLLLPGYRKLPNTISSSTTNERPETNCVCCRKRDQQLNKYNCIHLVYLFAQILVRRANKSVDNSVHSLSFTLRNYNTTRDGKTFYVYGVQTGKFVSKSLIFLLRIGRLWIHPKGEIIFKQYFSPHYEATRVLQPQPLRQELNLIGDNSERDDPDRHRSYRMSCSRNSLNY
jgi:hypothetical protein